MRTVYLKAESRQDLYNALVEAELAIESEEEGISISEGFILDEIGTIYKGTGNFATDEEGNEYEVTEAVEGYHANLIGEISPEQEVSLPVIPVPQNPMRKLYV